jgi:hypothetical protein
MSRNVQEVSSPNTTIIRMIKSRRMKLAGHVTRMVKKRNAYRILVANPEGKRPLGRPKPRWEDNIQMNFRETGGGGMAYTNLAQDRDEWKTVIKLGVSSKFWEILEQLCDWRHLKMDPAPWSLLVNTNV